MTEQQQELYEKLLKKVNEYCLGQAAEDVIAAIDDLVENYEKSQKALEIIKKYNIHNCSVIMATDSYKDYKICWVYDTTKMTEQEYELLKEVLK